MSQPVRCQEEPFSLSESWAFYRSPGETWEAMYVDCEMACRSIEFEQYILDNDDVGQRFMELFIRKAGEGTEVVLILDRFGSQNIFHSPLVKEFTRQGGYLHFYHPIAWWHGLWPKWWFPRTHTKTLLVDSAIAYTGGVCISARMRHWRDTHMRFTGPAIHDVREAFNHMERRIWKNKKIPQPPLPAAPPDSFRYVQHWPKLMCLPIYNAMLRALAAAEKEICISVAYFLPNRRFRNLLKQAARRGVKVQIIVPEHSDRWLVDWVRLSYAHELLKAGIRIYHYQPTVLHCKIMRVDNRWATLGSANMDIISFFFNREANVIITGPEAISELNQHFTEDLQQCRELTLEQLQEYPLLKRAVGRAARLLQVFLRIKPHVI